MWLLTGRESVGRLIVGLVVVVGFLSACATPEPVAYTRPRPPSNPPYAWKPVPQEPPPVAVVRPSKVTPRSSRTPARYDKRWFPRRGKISRRWTTIVIHHSATDKGGAEVFDRYHRRRGWDELGYHFVIGNGTNTPDGYVEVGSRWHKQKHGAHCKTPSNYYNEHGIGICLVGDFNKSKPTRRQLASLERLVRFLQGQCGIRASRVTTHRSVTHKTQCPGRHFPLAALRRSLSRSTTATSLP
jgi:hypothetical protein